MATRRLGSSEETAREVLLGDNMHGRFYFVPIMVWHGLCGKGLPALQRFLEGLAGEK